MPRGPRGEKRPEDPAQAAVMVVKIAAGELTEELDLIATKKDPAAVALGRSGGLRGGKARAEALSSSERQKIARAAAHARWSKTRGE